MHTLFGTHPGTPFIEYAMSCLTEGPIPSVAQVGGTLYQATQEAMGENTLGLVFSLPGGSECLSVWLARLSPLFSRCHTQTAR